jgi:DNA-damage-inducible protein J
MIPTVSRLQSAHTAKEKTLPVDPLIPNKETIVAMKSARKGKLTAVNHIDNLLDSLNKND